MKFRENRKINNSRTTHALFRVNGVSIYSLEMDYKRRLSLNSSPEAGATKCIETSNNGKAMIGDQENIGFYIFFKNKIIADFQLYLNSCFRAFRQVFPKQVTYRALYLYSKCVKY